ncbi:MAG: SGNH/GDSL hydrolase family protein [Sedimenticola sp.]
MFLVVGNKQSLLISDSIAKHVTGVEDLVVRPFPGRTIGGLAREVSSSKSLQRDIESANIVIVHVGTNDIFNLHFEDFPSALNNLFGVIRNVKLNVKLCYSAILPRPVDLRQSKSLVINANNRVRRFCKYRRITYLQSFRPFVQKNGEPHRHMFAVRDGGLHLNTEGSRVLSNFYRQVLNSMK